MYIKDRNNRPDKRRDYDLLGSVNTNTRPIKLKQQT